MAPLNITSANATAVLTVEKLYPAGIELQNFSTEQSISADEVTVAETRMGVDGHMSAGYVPTIYTVNISLEPGSASVRAINNLLKTQQRARQPYTVGLTITIPSIAEIHRYSNGVLKSGKFVPDGQKVLSALSYKFDFESFEPSSY